MTPTPTQLQEAEQHRLAVLILSQGLEWEMNHAGQWLSHHPAGRTPAYALANGLSIRVKPAPVTVDLAPEDVPPDSLLRCLPKGVIFSEVQTVTTKRVYCKGLMCLTYQQLREHGAEIKRPGEDWQPCSKPAP